MLRLLRPDRPQQRPVRAMARKVPWPLCARLCVYERACVRACGMRARARERVRAYEHGDGARLGKPESLRKLSVFPAK